MIKPDEVSHRIDWIRQQKGLTQEQLAAILQISQPAVSKYLRQRIPPAEALLKLAKLGQTTIEWILTGEKSYFYTGMPDMVRDASPEYDAEWNLSRRVAALPAEIRRSLHTLIEYLQPNDEPDGQ